MIYLLLILIFISKIIEHNKKTEIAKKNIQVDSKGKNNEKIKADKIKVENKELLRSDSIKEDYDSFDTMIKESKLDKKTEKKAGLETRLNPKQREVLKAIVYSEVLSQPKSNQK